MQDWTIRNVNNLEVIRLNGADYTFVPGSFEVYPAGYPDTVRNEIIETDDEKIKVRLGAVRYLLHEDGNLETIKGATPQTAWCQPLTDGTKPVDVSDKNKDGFITG